MGKLTKMTAPRRAMLEDLSRGPRSGILTYAPNKWLLEQGYITARPGKFGSDILEITPAGRAALSEGER